MIDTYKIWQENNNLSVPNEGSVSWYDWVESVAPSLPSYNIKGDFFISEVVSVTPSTVEKCKPQRCPEERVSPISYNLRLEMMRIMEIMSKMQQAYTGWMWLDLFIQMLRLRWWPSSAGEDMSRPIGVLDCCIIWLVQNKLSEEAKVWHEKQCIYTCLERIKHSREAHLRKKRIKEEG